MVRFLIGMTMALAFSRPAFADGERFGLDCTGETTKTIGSTAQGPTSSFLRSRSIDLSRNLWCDVRDCKPKPILIVTDFQLVLQDDATWYESIDRTSGAYKFVARSNTVVFDSRGTCEKVDFVPFPETKF